MAIHTSRYFHSLLSSQATPILATRAPPCSSDGLMRERSAAWRCCALSSAHSEPEPRSLCGQPAGRGVCARRARSPPVPPPPPGCRARMPPSSSRPGHCGCWNRSVARLQPCPWAQAFQGSPRSSTLCPQSRPRHAIGVCLSPTSHASQRQGTCSCCISSASASLPPPVLLLSRPPLCH